MDELETVFPVRAVNVHHTSSDEDDEAFAEDDDF